MIRTPNYDSITRKTYGDHWRGFEAPRHLCLFNRASLEKALELAGFRVQLSTMLRSATAHYVESSMQIRAAETGGAVSTSTTKLRVIFYNVLTFGGQWLGKSLGDELHVVGVK
jgi:hypothetical protein